MICSVHTPNLGKPHAPLLIHHGDLVQLFIGQSFAKRRPIPGDPIPASWNIGKGGWNFSVKDMGSTDYPELVYTQRAACICKNIFLRSGFAKVCWDISLENVCCFWTLGIGSFILGAGLVTPICHTKKAKNAGYIYIYIYIYIHFSSDANFVSMQMVKISVEWFLKLVELWSLFRAALVPLSRLLAPWAVEWITEDLRVRQRPGGILWGVAVFFFLPEMWRKQILTQQTVCAWNSGGSSLI